MTIAAAILLTAAAFAAVVYPFFRSRNTELLADDTGDIKEIQHRRDHTYALLKEAENDYKSGTLSKEDYLTLENRYKNRAVSILKELDEFQRQQAVSDTAVDDIESQVSRLRRSKKGRFCPYCGSPQIPDARFCPDCGKRVSS